MDSQLDELLHAIEEQLYAGLEQRPSENDRLAISAALAEAAARGQQRGAATLSAQVRALLAEDEQLPHEIETPELGSVPDPAADTQEPQSPDLASAEPSDRRRRQVTDMWGNPIGARTRRKR